MGGSVLGLVLGLSVGRYEYENDSIVGSKVGSIVSDGKVLGIILGNEVGIDDSIDEG